MAEKKPETPRVRISESVVRTEVISDAGATLVVERVKLSDYGKKSLQIPDKSLDNVR